MLASKQASKQASKYLFLELSLHCKSVKINLTFRKTDLGLVGPGKVPLGISQMDLSVILNAPSPPSGAAATGTVAGAGAGTGHGYHPPYDDVLLQIRATSVDTHNQLSPPGPGYSETHSNQPLAGNIARDLELMYPQKDPTTRTVLHIGNSILPEQSVRNFLRDYFYHQDRANYYKVAFPSRFYTISLIQVNNV